MRSQCVNDIKHEKTTPVHLCKCPLTFIAFIDICIKERGAYGYAHVPWAYIAHNLAAKLKTRMIIKGKNKNWIVLSPFEREIKAERMERKRKKNIRICMHVQINTL